MAVLTVAESALDRAITRTAREYLRVSKGKGRTARSIRDQHRDNLEAEQEYGPWTWGEPYKDAESASKYARKARDDFEKLVIDLRTGSFGEPGDVLVLWEISRLARETGRGVEIIDLCEAGGYLVHVTSHERQPYNPRNYNDRHELISGIADAEREARRLSARTLRGLNSAAREGRPQGQVPFGYRRDYEVIDGRPRPVAQYPDPVQGPLVLELFERVAGSGDKLPEPIYAIAKDWEKRGVKRKGGQSFTPQNLRSMLLRPAFAGLRKHNGVLVREQWEGWTPIVPRELFDRVQTVLADPSRRKYTGAHIRHVLSMTLRCDVCGRPMAVMARWKHGRKTAFGYQCHPKGHVWVPKEETDRIIIGDLDRFDPETGERLAPELGVILAYLANPDRHAALRHQPDASQEEKDLRADLGRLNAELKLLKDAPKPATALARIERTKDIEEYETAIAELEAKLRLATMPAPLAGLLPEEPVKDVVRWWKTAGVEKQRAIAAALLTPAVLGEVRIMPSPVCRNSAPVSDRIVLRRDGG